MSSSILLPYQPLNRWNERAIQPGPQGTVGDVLTQVRIQQSTPDLPVKFNRTFSGANSSQRGSNVQDGTKRSFFDGGLGAQVITRKRQKYTNVGWVQQDLTGNDRSFQSVMAPQPRAVWVTQVDSILHRQGDAFQILPGGYGPEPGQLLRGGQVPRAVFRTPFDGPLTNEDGTYVKTGVSRPGVNNTVVETNKTQPQTQSVVVAPTIASASNDQMPAQVQAEPTREPKKGVISNAVDFLGNAMNTMSDLASGTIRLSEIAPPPPPPMPASVPRMAPPPPPLPPLYIKQNGLVSPTQSVVGKSEINPEALSLGLRGLKPVSPISPKEGTSKGVSLKGLLEGKGKLKKVEQKQRALPKNELQEALSQAISRRRISSNEPSPTSSNDDFFDAPDTVVSPRRTSTVVEPRASTRSTKGQRNVAGKFTG